MPTRQGSDPEGGLGSSTAWSLQGGEPTSTRRGGPHPDTEGVLRGSTMASRDSPCPMGGVRRCPAPLPSSLGSPRTPGFPPKACRPIALAKPRPLRSGNWSRTTRIPSPTCTTTATRPGMARAVVPPAHLLVQVALPLPLLPREAACNSRSPGPPHRSAPAPRASRSARCLGRSSAARLVLRTAL